MRATLTLALQMGIAACVVAPNAGAQRPDERAIRAARERTNRAIAAHDTGALAAEWASDLVVTTSVGAQQVGRAANVASFSRLFATRPDLVYRREPTKVVVHEPWETAGETGRWEGRWTADGVRIRVSGSYMAKWRRTGGRWELLSELYVAERCQGEPYCSAPPPGR